VHRGLCAVAGFSDHSRLTLNKIINMHCSMPKYKITLIIHRLVFALKANRQGHFYSAVFSFILAG
jgi:hypothetical protein